MWEQLAYTLWMLVSQMWATTSRINKFDIQHILTAMFRKHKQENKNADWYLERATKAWHLNQDNEQQKNCVRL